MRHLVRTSDAAGDLIAIGRWIAQDNEDAALRMVDQIDQAIELLRDFPLLGQAVDSIRPGMRRTSTGPYAIYYRLLDGGETVEVARVVHGARDIGNIFP